MIDTGSSTGTGLGEIFGLGPAKSPMEKGYSKAFHEVLPGHFLEYSTAEASNDHTYWKLESRPHDRIL